MQVPWWLRHGLTGATTLQRDRVSLLENMAAGPLDAGINYPAGNRDKDQLQEPRLHGALRYRGRGENRGSTPNFVHTGLNATEQRHPDSARLGGLPGGSGL